METRFAKIRKDLTMFTCENCGKLTREVGYGKTYCKKCFEEMGQENIVNDKRGDVK